MNDNTIKVIRKNDEPANRSLHGLTRTLIHNMIEGVTKRIHKRTSNKWCWIQSCKTRKRLKFNIRIFTSSYI